MTEDPKNGSPSSSIPLANPFQRPRYEGQKENAEADQMDERSGSFFPSTIQLKRMSLLVMRSKRKQPLRVSIASALCASLHLRFFKDSPVVSSSVLSHMIELRSVAFSSGLESFFPQNQACAEENQPPETSSMRFEPIVSIAEHEKCRRPPKSGQCHLG